MRVMYERVRWGISLENLSLWVRTRSDTNWAVQQQKMARGLKFRIQEIEGLNYLCSKNKDADQLHINLQLICAIVFAYAKSRFSHDAAHVRMGTEKY